MTGETDSASPSTLDAQAGVKSRPFAAFDVATLNHLENAVAGHIDSEHVVVALCSQLLLMSFY